MRDRLGLVSWWRGFAVVHLSRRCSSHRSSGIRSLSIRILHLLSWCRPGHRIHDLSWLCLLGVGIGIHNLRLLLDGVHAGRRNHSDGGSLLRGIGVRHSNLINNSVGLHRLQVSVSPRRLSIGLCLQLHGLRDDGGADAAVEYGAEVASDASEVDGARGHYLLPALIASNTALISDYVPRRADVNAAASHPEGHPDVLVEGCADAARHATSCVHARGALIAVVHVGPGPHVVIASSVCAGVPICLCGLVQLVRGAGDTAHGHCKVGALVPGNTVRSAGHPSNVIHNKHIVLENINNLDAYINLMHLRLTSSPLRSCRGS